MEQITARLRTDTIAALDDMADERGISRSECIRELLDTQIHGETMADKYEDSQQEVERLQTEVERLRREKRQILSQRSENQQLRRYIEAEREHAEKTRQANLPTRLKWLVFGDQE